MQWLGGTAVAGLQRPSTLMSDTPENPREVWLNASFAYATLAFASSALGYGFFFPRLPFPFFWNWSSFTILAASVTGLLALRAVARGRALGLAAVWVCAAALAVAYVFAGESWPIAAYLLSAPLFLSVELWQASGRSDV